MAQEKNLNHKNAPDLPHSTHLSRWYPASPRSIVVAYCCVQATAIFVWWLCLLTMPSLIFWFHPRDWPAEGLLAFAIPDGVLLMLGSVFCAWAVAKQQNYVSLAVWTLAGVGWYPTLYCLGVSCLTDEAWLATALMTAMAGMMTAMATILGTPTQTPATYRATRLKSSSAIFWTLLQVVIFWGTFLIILPKGLNEVEQKFLWQNLSFVGQGPISISLIGLASCLGLASGMAMARQGQGTPLPTASAPELVCTGPYRWIRNPMALAGIVQGLGVGIFLGSLSVIAYAILGGILWHVVVRPSEELELQSRFGDAYQDYRRKVGLWLPRIFRNSG
jgi:protein-S-isoprenylcysteine O-methyltransferase Ste14